MAMPSSETREVTGIILAGGKSRRLGRDKALLELGGRSLLSLVVAKLRSLCTEVVIAGGLGTYDQVPGVRLVADIHPGHGALGGIHAGLQASHTEYGLVVGCDMPFLNRNLLSYMIGHTERTCRAADVIIPRLNGFTEPLHAVYSRRCLGPIEEVLAHGGGRIITFFSQVRVIYIEEAELNRFDPQRRSFFNVNTPSDWRRAQQWMTEAGK
jgi:molybdopterin-guanine dinucleotide biosynthesis protein A